MPTTAYITHPDYRLHTLENHPEHAGRIEAVWQLFERTGILNRLLSVDPVPATPEQLGQVHDSRYIDFVRQSAERGGGMLDPDTYLLPVSYDVACLAAGGVITAVDVVLAGQADNGLALVRPPGHHATASRAMGFCLFNNVAIAARYAQSRDPSIKRVMIVDYDVHHGNGTQDTFYDDPDVFYISTHQYPHYPGTGALNEIGEGEGKGTTLNMPLPAGVGSDGFRLLYQQVLWPAARRFRPDLILVSAGFDAHWADHLAMLHLDLRGYTDLARELIRMADDLCKGRIVFVLEGGYDLEVLSHGLLNVVYALQGLDELSDPVGDLDMPQQDVESLVDQLVKLHHLDA
ncbi:MAG: histone deacetylase [Anaerolineae bacterium]|nr:histone deacetylase [Anaerolineae bacterium]